MVLFAMVISVMIPGFVDDLNCWRGWALAIHEHGLKNVYDSDTNYVPLLHYILWFYAKICGSKEAIESNIFILKWITLIFEISGFYLVYRRFAEKTDLIMVLLLGLFNIGAAYNNIIWGQIDGILATLVFAAIYYASNAKVVTSCIFMTLALLFKLQAICFLPLWSLVCLYQVLERRSLKLFFTGVIAIIVTMSLVLLRFAFKEGGLQQVWNVYTGYVDSVPKLALGAFNFWSLLKAEYLGNYSDADIWIFGLSYKMTGRLMFVVSFFLVLLPLLIIVWKKAIKRPAVPLDARTVLLTGALSCLVFYYFNTQMHERYCHSAFIFLLAYAVYSRDYIPYLLFTIAYFLNLEAILRTMKLTNYETLVFHQKFISLLYAVNITYLFVRLYVSRPRITNKEPNIDLQ